MSKRKIFIFSLFVLFASLGCVFAVETLPQNPSSQNILSPSVLNKNNILPENTLYIELKDGVVIAELFPKVAPLHVQRIKILTKDGFYDNIKFHRVIDDFMVQTGDPTGTGRGGSRLGKLNAEFNAEQHTRGTLSMARASDPNSANSQFFIVTGDYFPELNGQYSVFGRVVDGMEYVDNIKTGNTANNGMVENPDTMIKVITGDMLNNKTISQIKEEIAIVNKVQEARKLENPDYEKRSILDLLVQTKDLASDKNNNVSEKSIQDNIDNKTKNQNTPAPQVLAPQVQVPQTPNIPQVPDIQDLDFESGMNDGINNNKDPFADLDSQLNLPSGY